jgi:hypothetical protein
MTTKFMWEILVPTVRPNTEGTKFFKTRYHRVWDAKVREITGGLTIMSPVKGQWCSLDNILFEEKMIPVRIVATRSEIEDVIAFTLDYYEQEAVLAYKISEEVIFKKSGLKNSS